MYSKFAVLLIGVLIAISPTTGYSGSLDHTYGSNVKSGTWTVVDRAVYLNPDCTTHFGTKIEIVSPPAHGSIRNEEIEEYSFRSPDPRFEKCDGTKVTKEALFYSSVIGYSGQDRLVARRVYPDGSAPVLDTIVVNVEK